MRILTSTLSAVLLLSFITLQAEDQPPFASEETLRYTINWPSGLDLGEARLAATQSTEGAGEAARWSFELDLEAAIPGFQVADHIRATADSSLCSLELEKQTLHGERTGHEKTVFNQGAKRAKRSTLTEGGGESEFDTPVCAQDGLTFLYHLRGELSRGRIPAPQTIFLGSPYDVSFERAGSQTVLMGEETVEADQMIVTVEGPASESTFILLVARDEARTPIRITAPLEPGNFTMELAQE